MIHDKRELIHISGKGKLEEDFDMESEFVGGLAMIGLTSLNYQVSEIYTMKSTYLGLPAR